jgi:2,3-bisphosphoglycerate-dependent phosphoglycerate mutase
MGNEWLPTHKDWRLNERLYGALTGLNKAETVAEFGEEKLMLWRRSYDVPPPALDEDSKYWPGHDRRYASVPREALPKTESLKTTLERVLPMWQDSLAPQLNEGKRVLVVAHGNSLRALIKHLDGVSEKTITGINIPTGVPLVYNLDEYTLRPVPHGDTALHVPGLSCNYVGDAEAIAAEVAAVAAQASAK